MRNRLTWHNKRHVPVLACVLSSLVIGSAIPAKSVDDYAKTPRKNAAVIEWFKRYDQIRCEAECTAKDKCQMLFLGEHKADKNNAALAERMIKKYTVATSEIKQLRPTPETRELQRGYTEYFSSARLLFTDFLKAERTVPFSIKQLTPAKNRLETLDKNNKRIDAELRKKFGIPKHKHS
ncbi:MAG: hypothetical protein K2Y22_15985 [Candidatus Obscuribacterales bacterium]|nr:hypothetical protein [Candidatus Obscuribacterales bacterium]